MGRINVAFAIDFMGGGGAERQLLNLINHIDRNSFQPSLITIVEEGSHLAEVEPSITKTCFYTGKRSSYCKAIGRMRRYLGTWKPDIIQCWSDYSAFVTACAACLSRHKPLFIASHRVSIEELYRYDARFGALKKAALLWAYRRADHITTNSGILIEQLSSYGLSKVSLIYNGIRIGKLDDKAAIRTRLGMAGDSFRIIYAGSLVRRKGIHDLLYAFSRINDPNMKLMIIGEGREKATVTEQAQRDKRIEYLGYRENSAEYIKAADMLVLPSQYEGLPNVVMEAMTVGTPVIATNIYGNKELITHQVSGILVPYGDCSALEQAMRYCMNHIEKLPALTEEARKKVSMFSLEIMVNAYKELYLSKMYKAS
jgi:glycosyltransferase involved in cell wall biosynthesis